MSASAIWFAAGGRLRSPWRLLLFCAALLPCAYVAAYTVGQVAASIYLAAGLEPRIVTDGWIELGAAFLATVFALRFVDRLPWATIGLGRSDARPALLARGFVVGALAIGVPILLLLAAHWLALAPGQRESWFPATLRVSIFLLPAALAEELLFRGYIFTVLRGVWGWRVTLVVTSLLFGLVHLMNGGATLQSIALVVLAGFFLGGVLVATGSLYASWMAHFAWNWTMAVVFHTAVSGIAGYPMEYPDYRYVDHGPDWATGGPWGPEGGAAGGLGMMGGIAYLIARRRRREES